MLVKKHNNEFFRCKFQSIHSANIDFDKGNIKWENEWSIFIDGLIQLNILAQGGEGIAAPKLLQELVIDVFKHETIGGNKRGDDVYFTASLDHFCGVTRYVMLHYLFYFILSHF